MSTRLFQTTITDPNWPMVQADMVQPGWIQMSPVFAWVQPPLLQSLFSYVLAQVGLVQTGLMQAATYSPPVYAFAQAGLVQPDMTQAQTPAGYPPRSGWTQTYYQRPARRLAQENMAQWSFIQGV
jgi:hypothetical protein